jgi:multicomponent K+:H+ antiporter subunit A
LDFYLPLLGEVHLSSVLVFDLGVFMLVFGATLLMLVALAHQSLRSPRKTITVLSADPEEQMPHHTTEAG